MAWTCTITDKDPVQFIVFVEYTDDATNTTLPDQFLVPPNVLATYITDTIAARLSALSARDKAFAAIEANSLIALDSQGATQITVIPVVDKLS